MIELKKILVATDFSDHSRVALDYAAEFSKAFSADVVLCHVVGKPDLMSHVPPGGEGYFPPNIHELQEQHAQKECERLLAEAGLSGGRIVIATGTPFVEVIRLAREENIDLLIIGTHGRGAIAHMLMGSVAEKIVRKASCPVLTVRHGEHEFVLP